MVKELVEAGHGCEIGPLLHKHGLDGARDCRGEIEGLHERRKRTANGSLVNPDNLVPACNPCNGWVEDNPDEAHILELVIREGDPLYDALGKWQDPPEGVS